MAHYIVTEDKSGKLRQGEVITVAQSQVLTDGVSTMPVNRELLEIGAISGYFRRDYGKGLLLSDVGPAIACKLALYVSPVFKFIHWSARIAVAIKADIDKGGSLRLVADSSQGLAAASVGSTSITAYPFSRITEDMIIDGGCVIQGTARLSVNEEGTYGFGLYGSGRGVRVLWAAITQTE